MAELPTFRSDKFQWTKTDTGHKAVSWLDDLGINRFPSTGFYIESARTKRKMLFLPDRAEMEAHDFFDGEASVYFVPGGNLTARIGA